ncbi:MAG: SAM-dependent methyltransferase, partial [Deltaproteobacteria bacterium]|nr:SAM-dependent methyltransferase [Deltaproteobacteria bacterium]
GGRLIYGVCSVLPEEGEEVAQRFAADEPAFRLCPADAFPAPLAGLFAGPGFLRLWPHRHRTDGFFYAVLDRLTD